jgi:hypothetical protein
MEPGSRSRKRPRRRPKPVAPAPKQRDQVLERPNTSVERVARRPEPGCRTLELVVPAVKLGARAVKLDVCRLKLPIPRVKLPNGGGSFRLGAARVHVATGLLRGARAWLRLRIVQPKFAKAGLPGGRGRLLARAHWLGHRATGLRERAGSLRDAVAGLRPRTCELRPPRGSDLAAFGSFSRTAGARTP